MRSLYIKEARKGAFHPSGNDADAMRIAFCEHVEREFGPSVLTVIDCLPYFRQKAKDQLGDETPLAALVLYATWLEHWINVLMSMAMLRDGAMESDVDAYIASRPRSKDKVERLRSLCRSQFPDEELGWIFQVIKTRARYHHYVWKGKSERWIRKDLKGMGALVRKGDKMLSGLLAFERAEFDEKHLALADEMFPVLANTR